jgi:hypothetical protein
MVICFDLYSSPEKIEPYEGIIFFMKNYCTSVGVFVSGIAICE